jgi:hypothetical protein
MKYTYLFSFSIAGLCATLPLATFAQSTPPAVNCSAPASPVEQKHCTAKSFFEGGFLPLPQCSKHPKTYGETGWRSAKGDPIIITNKHHTQKQAYCNILKTTSGTSGAVTSSPAVTPQDHPAFIFDPVEIGPEPKCDSLSGMELRICKVQLRTWRTLDRQMKWQKRQEERQSKIENTINEIFQLLRSKSTTEQLRSRTSQVERTASPSGRSQSIRGLRTNTYRGYIRPSRSCRSLPLREREACMKGLSF